MVEKKIRWNKTPRTLKNPRFSIVHCTTKVGIRENKTLWIEKIPKPRKFYTVKNPEHSILQYGNLLKGSDIPPPPNDAQSSFNLPLIPSSENIPNWSVAWEFWRFLLIYGSQGELARESRKTRGMKVRYTDSKSHLTMFTS